MIRLVPGVLLLTAALTTGAAAQVTVTNCASGTGIKGAGLDLAHALTLGDRIDFQCLPGAFIAVEATLELRGTVTIDGGNTVTLGIWNERPMFGVAGGVPTTLVLRNLTVGITPPRGLLRRSPTGAIAMGDMNVQFDHVTVDNVVQPIRLDHGSATVADSKFLRGRGPLVSAAAVTLVRTSIEQPLGAALQATRGTVALQSVTVSGSGASTDLPSSFANCTLTITDSRFAGIKSQSPLGGALRTGCATEIYRSNFKGNAGGNGGAIAVTAAAPKFSLRASVLEDNAASLDGGAITFEASRGGRRLEIATSHFRRNTAGRVGGAVALAGNPASPPAVTLDAVTFKANRATQRGGAIGATDVALTAGRLLMLANTAGSGSAISLRATAGTPAVTVANAIAARGDSGNGAAIELPGGTVLNGTIVDNKGFGLRVEPGSQGASVRRIRVGNTVAAGNTLGNCPAVQARQIVDGGSNLQSGQDCGRWLVNAPKLDNFFVPEPGSPLVGAGDDSICASPPVGAKDFFGSRRPQARHCSIGAVEGSIEHLFNIPPRLRARAREQRFRFP